jgi:hypothetical protein
MHQLHQQQQRCNWLFSHFFFISFRISHSPACPQSQLPTTLPGGMSARFRVGTSLAAACKDLGYGRELGYNNFLYPNENDVRSLLMWYVAND